MAKPQPSILRQAILGQSGSPAEENTGETAVSEEVFPWEKTMDAELGSAVVRAPMQPPVPRAAPGHAGHMKLLFENAPVAMAMFDTEMRYLLANRRWIEDFKLANVEITGRSQYELFPTLHPGWRHVYERALSGQVVRSDRDAITQDGRPVVYRWEVRPWRHVDTSIGGVMISCERLFTIAPGQSDAGPQAGEAATSDRLWDSALPILAMTAEGRIVRSSKGASDLLRAGTAGGASLPFWQAFGVAENQDVLRKHVLASLNSVLADGRSYTVVFTETKDGNAGTPTQWLVSRMHGGVRGVPGELALVVGLPGLSPFSPEAADRLDRDHAALRELADELGKMQTAVKESAEATGIARQRESRLRAVLDLAPCGLMVLDDHARPLYHNGHVAQLLGREPVEGQSIETWLSEGARDEVHQAEISRRWTEGVWRKHLAMPMALVGSDGLLKEIEMRPIALPGGGLLVMMQDVTEARRSEELLRSTEAKYRTLVHESPVPIVLADRTGAVFDVNPAAEKFLGHTRAELRRMNLEGWLDEESLHLRARKLAEMTEHGERSASIRLRVIRQDGGSAEADLRLAMVTDANGGLLFSVHFFTPASVEPAPAPPVPQHVPSPGVERPAETSKTQALLLLATDVHGRIIEWGEDAEERFGYEADEILGRGLHTLFKPSDATGFHSQVLAVKPSAEDEAIPVEWTFYHKTEGRQSGPFLVQRQEDDGLAITLLEEITLISPTGTPPDAPVATASEPPVRRASRLDQSAQASVPAKPTAEELSRERLLLGEAHHRVKNHLQIITSMLNLQMSTLHNDEARDALRSSQNRVRSIAALHQHLFQLATGELAEFRTFASGLITHLRECYAVPAERVALQLDVPDCPVPEEWLMPLALSLNEMVSNAFKHAYPSNRDGKLKVELKWDHQEGSLTVEDDGVGLPSGFCQHETAGLGLKILRVFAGQIGGEVKITSGPGQGTSFQLTFPVTGRPGMQTAPEAAG